jgi:hypothetical protein
VAATVTGIQTIPVTLTSLTSGQQLQYNGSAWVNVTPSGGSGITTLTGDVTAGPGSGSQAATVARVNGATVPAAGSLTTGNAAYVSGVSALTYSALNLAGGSGWITGTLPLGNGGTGLNTASGLTTGNVLQATSGTALGYAPINLAGGAGYVTGVLPAGNMAAVNLAGGSSSVTGQLPVANLANGTAAQILVTNSGATAPAWVSVSGDSIIAASGAVTNTAMRSGEYTWGTSGTVTWATATDTPVMTQTALASTSSASGTAGQAFTLTAQAGQAATGASHNGGAGGNIVIGSGAGGTSGSATAGASGMVQIQVAGTTMAQLGAAATDFIAMGAASGSVSSAGLIRIPSAIGTILSYSSSNTILMTLLSGPAFTVGLGNDASIQFGTSNFGFSAFPLTIANQSTPSASTGARLASVAGAGVAVGTGGAITYFAPVGSGTANTQNLTRPSQMGVGRVVATGGTVVLNVPLATSGTTGTFTFTGLIRVVTASVASVGDSFSITYRGTWKNVGGTVSLVPSLTGAVSNTTTLPIAGASDASLTTSTLVFSVSGTNIVATLTANVASGTLSAADCTIDVVEAIIN